PPPIGVPLLFYAPRLFDSYRQIPGDRSLDSGRALAGPNGQEVATKMTCGRTRTVRSIFDGVHLTPDGARIYGERIAHDFTASRSRRSPTARGTDRTALPRAARPGPHPAPLLRPPRAAPGPARISPGPCPPFSSMASPTPTACGTACARTSPVRTSSHSRSRV